MPNTLISNLQAIEALIEALKDSNSGVRQAAAATLGQIGYTRAVDNDRVVRAQAAEALAQLEYTLAAVEQLSAALKNDDSARASQAAEALWRLGNIRAVEPLVAAAVEPLVAAAVEQLIAVLEDDDRSVHVEAAYALGQLGDTRAVEPLVAILKDDDRLVRAMAAAALGQLGDTRAVKPLIAALEDDDSLVRALAAEALGRLGDIRAVEPLIKALRDSDSAVRQAAASALREIGDPRGVDALRDNQQAARDKDRSEFAESPHVALSTTPTRHSDFLKERIEASQLRYFHARYPERVRVGDRIPLQVRVALSPAPSKSTPLRFFSIPPQGVDVKLVLDCPGFLLHSASIATVHVVPEADSDWALFELEALHEGVSTLEVSAFHGGAFLGTLSMQLTVDHVAVRGPTVERLAFLSLRPPQEGEVTLVIHYDPSSAVFRYQFRSAAFGETGELRSGPLRRKQEEAIADLIASFNEQARDLTGYSAEETRRWLQGKGIELWNELIPRELQNVFWQQRDNIKCMTILSAGDPMPWEVMYPTNDTGSGAGFLAEQFPVVRWMFGPPPTPLLHCTQPFFVMPEDAPPTAEDELAALRQIIGEGQEVNELTPLLSVFDQADFDMLHFACHNVFRSDSPTTSCIQMGSKPFVPTFLSTYRGQFYRRSPLVFLNACRSAGMAANYTWLAGWAKSFLAAGAGAFIGSLWEVRDTSASRFAEEFYQALFSGAPLGDAMKQARTAIQNEPGDPTWLAYTLYGNPTAILLKETPTLG